MGFVINLMSEYVGNNGKYALNMHVFQTGVEGIISENIPLMKIEERLVMVKSNTKESVKLLDMESKEIFEVSLDEYKSSCKHRWMLDESLTVHNQKEWERQSLMVRKAYEICGLKLNN